MKNNLNKEEMQDAIIIGVKEAILEMCESGDGYNGPIRKEEIFEKIREGVHDAFWQLFSSATMMPCQDFYDTVKEGVKEAISELEFPDITRIKQDAESNI